MIAFQTTQSLLIEDLTLRPSTYFQDLLSTNLHSFTKPKPPNPPTMPTVTLHCIRHAQGYHNLSISNHTLTDPRLTPHGESQCLDLQTAHFPPITQSRISLITASPLTRTLHTAYLTFQPLLDPSHPEHAEASKGGRLRCPEIVALPDAQETSDYPCDTGSSPSLLRAFLAEQKWPVDSKLLTPSWTDKGAQSRYSPHSAALKTRARDARVYLRQRAAELLQQSQGENVELVLVTHGGYLHYFTGDWEDASAGLGTGWKNCETRSYNFENSVAGSDAEAKIIETEQSRTRRGKTSPMPSWAQQNVLEEQAMQGWADAGLQVLGWEDRREKEKTEQKEEEEKGDVFGPGLRQVESQEVKAIEESERRERRGSVTVRAQA